MHSFLKEKNLRPGHMDFKRFSQPLKVCFGYEIQYHLMITAMKLNQSNFWLLFQFRSSYNSPIDSVLVQVQQNRPGCASCFSRMVTAQTSFSFRFVSTSCAYYSWIHEKQCSVGLLPELLQVLFHCRNNCISVKFIQIAFVETLDWSTL